MTFNVEYGGTVVEFQKVVDAATLARADIIGLEEPQANAALLAEALGFAYVNARTDVISRYPIIDPPGADGRYVFVEIDPGRVVAIANVHLPSDPYGPYLTAEGAPLEDVLALENRLRLPKIRPFLDALEPLIDGNVPVFLVGDFNAPSHLDWTAETVGLRPQITYPVQWPVSRAVESSGLRDSFRDVYPDPIANPGLTWWAARPNIHDEFPASDPQDRIDLVFTGGPSRTLQSEIVGERGAPGVSLTVDPWPSDHRGVVSTFEVLPAPLPVLVAVEQRLVALGEHVTARFHAPGRPGERLVVYPRHGRAQEPSLPPVSTGRGSPRDGTATISTSALEPGAYQLALVSRRDLVLSETPFWVRFPDAPTTLALDATAFGIGESIPVHFATAPGHRWDWVAVYRAPADPLTDDYLIWSYTGAQIEGRVTLDESSEGVETWPLEPGNYEVLYLLQDAYEVAARTAFTVSP
jgi:endonuclease/exonuclease/phosphatase family metal-dependent hydrolase